MNSIFGPAKSWFTSLPTSTQALDPEPAASSSNSSTPGHSHAIDTSSSSPKRTEPDDESSSDDNRFNTAIQDHLRQNPVQETPKEGTVEDKVEEKEPFGGRFEYVRAALAKESKGTEDSDDATKSLQANFSTSSTKHDAEAGPSKRPLVVEDLEVLGRSGSVDSAKRRRLSIGQHRYPGYYDHLFSKDQRQRFKREPGSSHYRIRAPLRPLSKNVLSRMSPCTSLDHAKSKEIAKSIRNTPTTAGVKATEKVQQIKERAKETQAPKRTEEQVLREFTKAPIESIFGGKTTSNPTNTTVPSRSQPTKDARRTQGGKNPASSQTATHQTAQATQSSRSKEKPSISRLTQADVDQFNFFKDKGPQTKHARIVNHLPSSFNEERTGYKFTAQRATNDFQQSLTDGRPVRPSPASRRKKSTIPSSSKNPPAPTTSIHARPPTPPPHHLPAAPPPVPEPAPDAAIPPPPPPKKAVPAQSLLSPTDVILQYVIKQTKKHPISESDSVRHYRSKVVYTSKKEANETCRRRVLNLLKEDIPFQAVEQGYVGDHLFKGTIFYEDGDVQFYYVHEEAAMLGDVLEKRELWVDEEGMGIYAKRMWAVWAVRYYPSEEEETKSPGVGMGSGNGRVEVDEGVEVVDEGVEGGDEDDGEEEEDLFGCGDVDGQLNEGVTSTTSEDLVTSGSQTNMNNSQTESHQTQTQTELKLETQQEITSDGQGQSQSIQTPSDEQTQPTLQTHQRLEGDSDAQPELKSQPESVTQPQPEPQAPSDPTQQAQPQPPSQSQPINPPRPPTPPLPCSLYSPPPPSTIYSSSSESDSEDISHTRRRRRSLPNNIPPPPPPLPSSTLLHPATTLHGTFTTLRLANLEALEIFKALTKPKPPARMNDVSHWRDEVVPEAEARFKEWTNANGQDDDDDVVDNGKDINEQQGNNENDADDYYGNVIEKTPFNIEWEPDAHLFKWRFRKVQVWVQELKLKGPKDLGGLEVRQMPSRSSEVAGRSTGTGNGNAGGVGPVPASTSISEAARPRPKARGAGTVKVNASTATATTSLRTAAPRTDDGDDDDDELANQHTYYRNAREELAAAKAKAKGKKRRRPTREEKGKCKAIDVDPVVRGQGNGKLAMQEGEDDEWGGIEEGDLSEEESFIVENYR
ncbi:hypothetical protein GE21DRAFT_4920 [Neurospora crassa]|uniref:Uncharacterized protein n=1 Tax=Neurospora crassa (strain ATCC 24698 / 74-OR23-1A / CBS 708.71 / DSM 1257 / FGSC 987) TaxID=367110 RepID=Q7S1Z6_NEUCR|nr:hypothetical protein NCU07557 [Neurospora crassa OR74A]EAA29366.1 hypothetical protein NCU07557 [Neurospora crassa OR74A]KHE81696.1 hypothetical protein GE21DRAFT_4920 [Neurospora crassa]|eukprot:XP_958602.1 hypothetical protein NCU07557 [Neurospora crassa OR74A]